MTSKTFAWKGTAPHIYLVDESNHMVFAFMADDGIFYVAKILHDVSKNATFDDRVCAMKYIEEQLKFASAGSGRKLNVTPFEKEDITSEEEDDE